MDNTKDWARRLERKVSGTQTLSAGNRTIATVSGVWSVGLLPFRALTIGTQRWQ